MPYCKTKLGEMWGIGAELRGVHYDYGKEFAVVLTGEETFTMNLHIIRTGGVEGQPNTTWSEISDVQSCIECHCSGGSAEFPLGLIDCCPDHTYCWSAPGCNQDGKKLGCHKFEPVGKKPVIAPKKYTLQYTMAWSRPQPSSSADQKATALQPQPLTMVSFDATSPVNQPTGDPEGGGMCAVEYLVPRLGPGQTHAQTTHFTLAGGCECPLLPGTSARRRQEYLDLCLAARRWERG